MERSKGAEIQRWKVALEWYLPLDKADKYPKADEVENSKFQRIASVVLLGGAASSFPVVASRLYGT